MKAYLKYILVSTLSFNAGICFAQTGTYTANYKGGASCTIAVEKDGNKINADIFAWWHTQSGRMGTFSGDGVLKNGRSVLHCTDDADCSTTLTFTPAGLKAVFGDCINSNLLPEFSGPFKKISTNTPGDYVVAANRSYFYKDGNGRTPKKAYLLKGDKVKLDIENIDNGSFVFINYTNAQGKNTNGYMRWSDLKQL